MARRKLILFIDCALAGLLILLYSPIFTSLTWHEMLGVFFLLPLFTHLLLSWSWISQSIRRFLTRNNLRNRINFLLNLSLFFSCITGLASGIIISQRLLPSIGINTLNDSKWRSLHNQSSAAIAVIVSLHIAINWPRLSFYLKKRIQRNKHNRTISAGQSAYKLIIQRTVLLLFASLIIAGLAVLFTGPPGKERLYPGNDLVRLKQNYITGSVQVLGAIATICILVYLARIFIKLRL